jgi:tRNA(Ile2) C34 agmatinyltransferase TiaS
MEDIETYIKKLNSYIKNETDILNKMDLNDNIKNKKIQKTRLDKTTEYKNLIIEIDNYILENDKDEEQIKAEEYKKYRNAIKNAERIYKENLDKRLNEILSEKKNTEKLLILKNKVDDLIDSICPHCNNTGQHFGWRCIHCGKRQNLLIG